MKAKIYVVLEDYDNGESYEEWYSANRTFVAVAGTEDTARQAIQDVILEMQKDDWYDDPGKISEDHERGRIVFERPSGCHVEKSEFYWIEKEVEIPD